MPEAAGTLPGAQGGRLWDGCPSGWLLDSQQSLPDTWLPQTESAAAPSMFRSLSGAEATTWRQAPTELWEVKLTQCPPTCLPGEAAGKQPSDAMTLTTKKTGKQGDDKTRPSLQGGVTGAWLTVPSHVTWSGFASSA